MNHTQAAAVVVAAATLGDDVTGMDTDPQTQDGGADWATHSGFHHGTTHRYSASDSDLFASCPGNTESWATTQPTTGEPRESSAPQQKRVRFGPVLSQTMPYYFYDPETGEPLEGSAARAQAKREVLGESWQETWDIVARDFRGKIDSVEAFLALENAVAVLPDPCLCLVGQQWRYVGGDRPRPCEVDEMTMASPFETDVSSNGSPVREHRPSGTPSSDAEDESLWDAEVQFASGRGEHAPGAHLLPTPEVDEDELERCFDLSTSLDLDVPDDDDRDESFATESYYNEAAMSMDEVSFSESPITPVSPSLFSADGTLFFGTPGEEGTAWPLDAILNRDRAETPLSPWSPELGPMIVHQPHRLPAGAATQPWQATVPSHGPLTLKPAQQLRARVREHRGNSWS